MYRKKFFTKASAPLVATAALIVGSFPILFGATANAIAINTWTQYAHLPSYDQWRGGAFDGTNFVIVNDTPQGVFSANNVRTSSDGVNWTSATISGDNRMTAMACGDGDCVVANYGKATVPRRSGGTWTSVSVPAKDWADVAYGGSGKFMMVSNAWDRDVIISTNGGASWSATATKFANMTNSIAYGEGVWVVAGNYWIEYSNDDGATWNVAVDTVSDPIRASFQDVTYANGMFMTTGGSGSVTSVYTSPDGITWTARSGAIPENWYRVGYGDGYWISVSCDGYGTEKAMISEDDGVTWTLMTSAPLCAEAIMYGNGTWVLSGYGGTTVGSYVAPTTTTTAAATTTTTTSGGSTTTTTGGGGGGSVPTDTEIRNFPTRTMTPSVVVRPGGKLTLVGSGFNPNERVVGVVTGHGSSIGSGSANASGDASIEVTVPTGMSGEQTFGLYAPRSGIGFSQVITVSEEDLLPPTGSDSRGLATALMVLSAGFLLVVAARSRASHKLH